MPARMRATVNLLSVATSLLLPSGAALAQMGHQDPSPTCAEPALRCASTVTPTFAPDGSLWITWAAAGHVSVARSTDLGASFSPAVSVNREPLRLDSGPDERPKIAVDGAGRVAVAFAIFKDSAFNGQVFYTHSTDGGATFAPPRPITPDPESQRFEAIGFDPAGTLFAAWLDKRKRAGARAKGEAYTGASLAFAWSNDAGATISRRAHRQGPHLRMLPARPRLCGTRPAGRAVPQHLRRERARPRGDDLRRPDDPGPDPSRQRRRLGHRRLPASRPEPRARRTAPITSPGSRWGGPARDCSTRARPTAAERSRSRCRSAARSGARRGPSSSPRRHRPGWCGRNSTASRRPSR